MSVFSVGFVVVLLLSISMAGTVVADDVGTEAWNHTADDDIRSSPTVVDGTVYVGSHDGNVYAVDADDGTLEWEFETGDIVDSSPAVVDGTVYVGSQDNTVYAIDAADGTEVWAFDAGATVRSSPMVVDGTVYVGSYENHSREHQAHVYALDAETGEEEWRFVGEASVWSSPAVADGLVVVGDLDDYGEANVYALNQDDGSLAWSRTVDGQVQSSATVVEGTVYIGSFDRSSGSDDHALYAFDADTGAERWSFDTDGGIPGSPTVVDDVVYVGTMDRTVHAVRTDDGVEAWNYTVDRLNTGEFRSSPTVADNTVFAGSYDNNLYALDIEDGSERWSFETGSAIWSSPTVVDGTVYVGSRDAKLYAIDADVGTSLDSRVLSGTLGHHDRDLVPSFVHDPVEPEPNQETTFDASAATAVDGTVETYQWDFTGDGSVDETTIDPVITHEFDAPGEYEVTLEVVDDAESTAQVTKPILVSERGDLAGVVRNESDGEPIPDVEVTVIDDGEVIGETTTDGHGTYDLELRVGSHRVEFATDEHEGEHAPIHEHGVVVEPDTTTTLDVDMPPWGDGSADSPHVITTVDLLQTVASEIRVGGGYSHFDHYVLGDDIEAAETEIWDDGAGFRPIGASDVTFTGTFDGAGYEISNLTIDRPDEDEVGLFGYLEDGEVTNLTITDASVAGGDDVGLVGFVDGGNVTHLTVDGATVSGGDRVGLVGSVDDGNVTDLTVNDVTVDGGAELGLVATVNGGTVADLGADGVSVTGNDFSIGGAVGVLNDRSTLRNATLSGTVSSYGSYTGGIGGVVAAANDNSSIVGVDADVDVTVFSGGYDAGGIVGYLGTSTLADSTVEGSVDTPVDWWWTGGAAGRAAANGSVSDTHADVGVSGDNRVGGVVGQLVDSTVDTSSGDGDVTGQRWVGGVVGAQYGGSLADSYAVAAVAGDEHVGGVAGLLDESDPDRPAPTLETSYAAGLVDGADAETTGSVIGNAQDGAATDSYWDLEVTTQEAAVGTNEATTSGLVGLETDEMRGEDADEAMAALDFEATWMTTESYPTLRSYGGVPAPIPSLSGTVSDAETDESIAGATVAVIDAEADAAVAQTETDGSGSYEFHGLESGSYDLVVSADKYETGGAQDVEIDAHEETVVDVELDPILFFVEITSTNEPVVEGETLDVEVRVEYVGDERANETVELRDADDELLANETVEFDDYGHQVVFFEWETDGDDVGTHVLRVEAEADSDSTEVEVVEFVPASFELSVDATNSPVTEGEMFVVDATVENVGDESGTETVELRDADGAVLANETVDLGAGESESITLEWATDEDDGGQYHFSVVTEDDAETVPVAVKADDLGIAFWPSQPEPYEAVTFYATDAENPTWEFGDGTTAQGSFVFHEYEWPWGTRTVNVTDTDGTEDSVEVPVSMPMLEWDPQPMASTSIDREFGGAPLSGVEWEETFTARLVSMDTVGAEAVDVEEFLFELGDETVTKDPETDGFAQEAEATFDLGDLDGDEELTVTAVTADGGEWEMTEMVTVTPMPHWLEGREDAFEVDQEAGTISTEIPVDDLVGAFDLGSVPIDDDGQSVGGDASAMVVYDANVAAATASGQGEFDADLLDASIAAGVAAEGTIDSQLELQGAWLAANAEVEGIPGPYMGVDAPIVGEVGVSTDIDVRLAAEGDFDGDFAFEEGTVQPGAGITVYVTVDVYCELYAQAYGDVDAAFDIGTDDVNPRGEVTVGVGAGVDCGWFEQSADLDYTHEFGGGLDGAEALVLEADDGDAFEDAEWEVTSKYGERPFSGGDGTASIAGAAAESDDGVDRLTDRNLEDTQPAIAAVDDDLLVVWSAQDEDKNVTDGRDLHYQRYDASEGEWSDTRTLTDDETSDERPALAASDEGVIAVWSTLNETVDPDEIDGPAELFPHYEIAYAIDDGDGWSESEVLTDTDEKQFAPSVVPADDGWLLAWESVELGDENVTGGDVRYATVDVDGEAGEVETIEEATLPTLGVDGETPTLAYATLDEGPGANVFAGESRTKEVRTDRIEDGERTDEVLREEAGNVTAIATDDGRTVWVDGVLGPELYESDGDGVTELDLREDVRGVSELALTTAGTGTGDGDAVLTYRAQTDGEAVHDLVYRLDRGDGWIADREHVAVGEANHTAWHADVTAAADGDGFHAAYAVQMVDQNATTDVFVSDHEFRPAFDLAANASAIDDDGSSTIEYELHNLGDVATDDGVTVVIENATEAVATFDHDSIDAGEAVEGVVNLTVDERGTFELSVDHDEETHDGVEEATVVAASPSLSISSVSSERVDGDAVSVDAVVENDGPTVAIDVPVGFDDGTTLVATETIDRIDPSDNATVTTTIDAGSIDETVVDEVRLDPDGELDATAIASSTYRTWLLQPDLDVGTVAYATDGENRTADVLVANHGTATTNATVSFVADDGTILGETETRIENASNASSTFASVPVDLDDVETGTPVTIVAEGPVPDATPSNTGITDEVGPFYASDRPTFGVTLATGEDPVRQGEELVVDVTVENRGEETDEQTLVLFVDGEAVDRIETELHPGFTTTESLAYTVGDNDGPSVDLRVESATASDAATAAIQRAEDEPDEPVPSPSPSPTPSPPSDDHAEFVHSAVELDRTTVEVGEPITVSVLVENVGEAAGIHDLALEIDDESIVTERVTLASGTSETVTFEYEFDAAGTYEVAVDGEAVEVVRVEAKSDDEDVGEEDEDEEEEAADEEDEADAVDDEADEEDEDEAVDEGDADEEDTIPGFGIAAALVALLAVGVLAWRVTDSR